jgi:hypothetical protein
MLPDLQTKSNFKVEGIVSFTRRGENYKRRQTVFRQLNICCMQVDLDKTEDIAVLLHLFLGSVTVPRTYKLNSGSSRN